MTPLLDHDAAAAFAAFREAVFEDVHLLLDLRRPLDPDAYAARVVAAGAARGFVFDAEAVLAALRAGEAAWRMEEAEPA